MIEPKLTLITLDYPPRRGGVARYLGEMVKAANGAIDVIVENNHDLSGPGAVRALEFFRASWPHWWPLIHICRDVKDDNRFLFVSHVFPVGTAAWLARLLGGPEYIVLFHGLDLRLARRFWKRWLLRRICSRSRALLTNSEATKKELLSIVPRAGVSVLTPAVEERIIPSREQARSVLGISKDEKIVLSVTRLVPRKGIDTALQAIARIQKSSPCRYVVIGDGPDRQRLESLAKQHGTNVAWLKNTEDDEKWIWLAASDMFLLPVREEEKDMEGFGIAFLEAAACGLPVIAGKSGGVEEAVIDQETGVIVNPTSIEEIEFAIRDLLANLQKSQELGCKGKERVLRDFQWKDRWDKLKKILVKT